MANYNYIGSVAERFMKFRSTLATEENISENLFNAISIYVPKSLASADIADGAYTPDEITADKYAVIAVTVDNYNSVLKETGSLLSQWLPIFNDGTNSAVTLYLIIFDDTDFAPTVGDASIVWNPLSKAFKELYFISFFKTMFSNKYDGNETDDANYFDMALCLAYQCEKESTLSFCLTEAKLEVFEEGEEDENACKVMSHTRGEETTYCKTLTGSDTAKRAEYFWGFLNLIAPNHAEFHIHNGSFMIPIVLGKWFEQTNDSGQYIGNKLQKIRLSGTKVKPTGLPSPLDSDVNLNLGSYIYDNLDAKNVGYFISISSNSNSDAQFIRERSIGNYPITAYMMSKFIDYQSAQDVANFQASLETLTEPVLVSEDTYETIQGYLVGNIQKMGANGRLINVQLKFPPFTKAKQGNKLVGNGQWKARYEDDLEGVEVSGSISF